METNYSDLKKIKVCCNWDSSENIVYRLVRQFKTSEIELNDVKFVYDDSYDIIVFFNYITENIKKNSKSFVFPNEPTWSGSHQKIFEPPTVVFGFKKNLYRGICYESIAYNFYGGRGPWVDDISFWNYDNLIKKKFEKTKSISSLITELSFDYGSSCLYPKRHSILNMVKTLNFVDIYGDHKISRFKKDALENYRFNISIENEYENNYITEKFYDCVLTDTVPIYFGCKNIKEIYPEKGYILIEDLDNLESIKKQLNYINKYADDIYKDKILELKKIKERYFREYNLLKKIINL